jgi:hypothetical protein
MILEKKIETSFIIFQGKMNFVTLDKILGFSIALFFHVKIFG